MANKGKVAAALVLTAGAVAIWRGLVPERERDRPARAVLGQVWIERMPRDPRDMVRQFVAFETPRRRLGLASAMSHWRVVADRFTWELDGHRMHAEFPQAQRALELGIRTWACKGEAPAPFELCLDLTIAGQTLHFFSREDWKIDPNGRVEGDVPVGVAWPAPPEADDGGGGYTVTGELPEAWRSPPAH